MKNSQNIIEKINDLSFSEFENSKENSVSNFVWNVFESFETNEDGDTLPNEVFKAIDDKIAEITADEEKILDFSYENPYEQYGVSEKDFF